MAARDVDSKLEAIEHQVRQLVDARARSGSTISPIFTLVVGGLLGALVAMLIVPSDDNGSSGSTTTAAAVGEAAPTGGTGIDASGTIPTAGADAGGTAATTYSGGSTTYSGSSGSGGSSTAGTSSSGGAASGSGSATAAGGGSTAANNGGIRGVTPTSAKVGLFCIDTTAFKNVYPNYYTGPCKDYIQSQINHLEKTGQNVIHGRKIEYVARAIPITDSTQAQAKCAEWAQQDKFFAIAGDYVGYPCFAQQFGGPTVHWAAGPTEEEIRANGPYYFLMGVSLDRQFRNYVAWAHARGHLKGKRIGVHYPSESDKAIQASLLGKLKTLGYAECANAAATGCIAAKTTYATASGDVTGQSATADHQIAVQRFIANRADLAMIIGNKDAFTDSAQQQRYKPTYIDNDAPAESTTDSVSQYYNPDQFDKTMAVTYHRYGERNAGLPYTPEQAQCVKNWESFKNGRHEYRQMDVQTSDSNKKPEATPHHILLAVCDLVKTMQLGLQRAGNTLTPATFKGALETFKGESMHRYLGITWTAGRHDGEDGNREMQWHKECLCYQIVNPAVLPAFSG